MGRVWVVGSLNVDRPWQVDRHPAVGETIRGEALDPVPGGKGLNQAVAAARMGADVVLVGRVGDDDGGRWLTSVASQAGIDVSRLAVDPHRPTGSALIVVADDGANTVTVAAGANAALAVDTLPLDGQDVVVAQLEVPEDAVSAAFAAAERVGATRMLNPSPLPSGSALADQADVLVLNEHEAAHLAAVGAGSGGTGQAQSGTGTVDAAEGRLSTVDGAVAAARRLASGGRTVVVTLGAAGAVASSPDGDVRVAGVDLSAAGLNAVDTTGAGDCFLGVLAAGLAAGTALEDALGRANRAAAIQVTRRGAVDAMPTTADLTRLAF